MDASNKKKDERSDEFKNQAVDLEGEEFLDINPMKKQCKYCGSEVVTYVEHELSPIFYGFALVSMFAFGWMFLFLLPLAYLLLKNAVHRCSRCLNEIGIRHMFGLPDLRQEILIIQLGKCSIVVSRTVGIAVTVILSIVFLYFSWFYDFGTTDYSSTNNNIEVMFPWTEYIEDCGSKVVISNSLRANDIFKRKYKNNFVNWSGYFIAKGVPKYSQSEGYTRYNSYINVLVKMEPSETEKDPDIVLAFTKEYYDKNIQFIESLQNGDKINFKAKFMSYGNEETPNIMLAYTISATGERKQLGDIKISQMDIPTSIILEHDKP